MSILDRQVQDYLAYCKYNRDFSDTTIKTKYYHIIKFARDCEVDDLTQLTNAIIDDWRTRKRENGMPLAKVSKWAGHSDSRITLKHYYKYNNKKMLSDHREAMEKAFS